ncbi:D-glutamate cyclase family protein [Paracoccus sp. (in: a-proteobacteria)]|uniref:D-glutamate cyclase family protein n=1 Tax=Paracoccus sp. TaxID=267 RepID=UPI003A86D973
MRPRDIRRRFREGRQAGQTAGLAPGMMQANIAILPQAMADGFHAFLRANPAVFPLLARGRPGDPALPELGEGIDIRRDLPLYRVFRHGRPAGDVAALTGLWRDDLVAFAIGCSLSFEADLIHAGVSLRCHGGGRSCSAFDSALRMAPVAPFGGNLVVSMRAIRDEHLELAAEITRAQPLAHGGPVHVGDPARIGVDLSRPVDGLGLSDVQNGETAMFWPCGVSVERAIAHAKPDLAITHAPGHMLITDLECPPVRRFEHCADPR